MYLFAFRFLNDDKSPTGYIGMATAATKQELFNVIDEFGNPYQAQARLAGKTSFCFHAEKVELSDGIVMEISEEEFGDSVYDECTEPDDWHDVDWKSDEDWLAEKFTEAYAAEQSDEMYWFEQAEKYHEKVIKLQKSNDQLIKSVNALMARAGHA